jgi:hypothetical protein
MPFHEEIGNGYACGHELIGPDRSKSDEGIPGVVPLLERSHLVDRWSSSPAFFKRFARPTSAASKDASLASSKTMGPPRAQEWMDRMEASLSEAQRECAAACLPCLDLCKTHL